MGTVLGCNVRWLIRRDMDAVLEIEQASFEWPWTEEEFLLSLRQRNVIGQVAVASGDNDAILGFMIYELHRGTIRLLNFCVADFCRRSGVGRKMVQRLIDKLSQQGRREIVLEVRETNINAQMFFSTCGFKAIRVLRDHYDDTLEDAYLMRYLIRDQYANSVRHIPSSG